MYLQRCGGLAFAYSDGSLVQATSEFGVLAFFQGEPDFEVGVQFNWAVELDVKGE